MAGQTFKFSIIEPINYLSNPADSISYEVNPNFAGIYRDQSPVKLNELIKGMGFWLFLKIAINTPETSLFPNDIVPRDIMKMPALGAYKNWFWWKDHSFISKIGALRRPGEAV